MARRLLVDVHTHVYLPRYVSLLRARVDLPRIFTRTVDGKDDDRLVILHDEPAHGRPVGPQYWNRDAKLEFMDKHGIECSVISSANPWLDFLSANEAFSAAQALNEDLEEYCASGPSVSSAPELQRFHGLGLLPLVSGISVGKIVDIVKQIKSLPHLRGVILGTKGIGNGLDDPELDEFWVAMEESKLVAFIHPHYGLPKDLWGNEQSHVLPLALGFPVETTICVTRLILAGVLDRHPHLRLLLAHSGGALPQLSSRLASCVAHDPAVASRLRHDPRAYLGMLWFDSVNYGSAELSFVADVIARGKRYLGETNATGSDRLLWGTDHPFFPPLGTSKLWPSVVENLDSISELKSWSDEQRNEVRGGNALRLFDLM
ncbi:hypothetical protein BKA62DRAFT_391216 [Auriculariales sp. MPI-PUGE-AT-0066]|nr:hypothetical protein BKA62DRAFT_391216 [Auriculariales sp. MPI-PUGE-AT-0066]